MASGTRAGPGRVLQGAGHRSIASNQPLVCGDPRRTRSPPFIDSCGGGLSAGREGRRPGIGRCLDDHGPSDAIAIRLRESRKAEGCPRDESSPAVTCGAARDGVRTRTAGRHVEDEQEPRGQSVRGPPQRALRDRDAVGSSGVGTVHRRRFAPTAETRGELDARGGRPPTAAPAGRHDESRCPVAPTRTRGVSSSCRRAAWRRGRRR